mgnify:FL=1
MFVVDHGTYNFDILVCIEQEIQTIYDYIEKKAKYTLNDEEKEKLTMRGKGRTVMLEGGQTILQLNLKKSDCFQAYLAHEVFHAVEFLFERIGLKHDPEISSEAFAYQIAYITGSIYEKLK